MTFLALDTSADYLSLALLKAGEIYAINIQAGQKHAEIIIDALRDFLARHQVQMRQIQGIAYGNGPGSFTGLRIGCAVAQGLAFAQNIPMVGISTLQALASQSTAPYIISCLDARMGELYMAAYQQEKAGKLTELSAPGLYSPAALPDLPAGISWEGTGSGFSVQAPALTARYTFTSVKATLFVQAREILLLALPQFAANQGVPAEKAGLTYLRDKVALTILERARA